MIDEAQPAARLERLEPFIGEWRLDAPDALSVSRRAERSTRPPGRAGGRSLLTLDFDDLEHELAGMRERGLDTGALDDTTSDKVLIGDARAAQSVERAWDVEAPSATAARRSRA